MNDVSVSSFHWHKPGREIVVYDCLPLYYPTSILMNDAKTGFYLVDRYSSIFFHDLTTLVTSAVYSSTQVTDGSRAVLVGDVILQVSGVDANVFQTILPGTRSATNWLNVNTWNSPNRYYLA